MTVAQLITALQACDPAARVFIDSIFDEYRTSSRAPCQDQEIHGLVQSPEGVWLSEGDPERLT